jgi:hypothetical protein
MTTIAWDGTTLAVDRQGTQANYKREVGKLYEFGVWVYATGACAADVAPLCQWLAGWQPTSSSFDEVDARLERCRETLEEGGVHGVVVHVPSGTVWTIQGKTGVTLVRVLEGLVGHGSGGDYALGAMAAGKTAREAVEIAMRFDAFTGFGIDTWSKEGV